ncbi:YbaN family protein [Silanimonas sp.]|uniref:YbaN family protein n=1 Tax=Silanimonas sp. TaxID=1929290 RepID=UPI001BC2A644|nr:YbaN family protein [Silanimonas sp.]MBS3896214.1 YbaN family protein [Silanimonas sp.]MBS3924079.1 YbaN family protein [Xanthomonadaceae bacterium]
MTPVKYAAAMWIDLRRGLWIALAYAALGLALLGVLLPGLPTTPFVLVAAWAAARGSRHLHDWLLAHRLFGPMIFDWQTRGAVSRPAKRAALGTMTLCALLLLLVSPKLWMAVLGIACMAVVAGWLWRRPE